MAQNIHERLLVACKRFMIPVCRMLLRSGIGYREFAELCKFAFVEVALADYGIRGRQTNMSRIAAMTGLTRKEVKRLRESLSHEYMVSIDKRTPVASVLHYWYTDKDFVDASGKPLEIPFDAKGMCFVELVKRYAGDIPPGAILEELRKFNAVEDTHDGRMRIVKRHFVSPALDDRIVDYIARELTYLGGTIDFKFQNWPIRSGRHGRVGRLIIWPQP